MSKDNSIPVLDSSNKVISRTTPARARILVKKSKASIFNSDPFMIKLNDPETKEKVMSNEFFDFFAYFREERPIFVQNVGNTLISFGFKTAYGQEDSVMLPNTPKPLCLTDYVSFDRLKESIDLRKMLNREPKVLKLLSKDEFMAYYQNLADMNDTTLEEELSAGRRAHQGIVDRSKLYPTTTESLQRTAPPTPAFKNELVEVEAQPSPKIVGLCARVSVDLEDKDKMSKADLMERLAAISDLTEADLDYIQSRAHYKEVKKWAAGKLEALVAARAKAAR